MKFLSLFSGIGGMDLGLERAGMTCIGQVENNPYCLKILHKHWPGVPKYADIKTFEFSKSGWTKPDIIAGGFPCTDLSYAGKRAGIDGEQTGLWREFHRIIREIRPQYVLMENVTALLDGGIGCVLGAMAEIGYDAEWDCIPAAAIGALHQRDRIFIVAYAAGQPQPESGLEGEAIGNKQNARLESGGGGQRLHFQKAQPNVADSNGAGLEGYAGNGRNGDQSRWVFAGSDGPIAVRGLLTRQREKGWWKSEPALGRVANGIPHRMDRLKGLGNAVVPAVAEAIGRAILLSQEQ